MQLPESSTNLHVYPYAFLVRPSHTCLMFCWQARSFPFRFIASAANASDTNASPVSTQMTFFAGRVFFTKGFFDEGRGEYGPLFLPRIESAIFFLCSADFGFPLCGLLWALHALNFALVASETLRPLFGFPTNKAML